jgi:hypothetical protein
MEVIPLKIILLLCPLFCPKKRANVKDVCNLEYKQIFKAAS